MNMLYLKNDLDWDLNHYLSIINLCDGNVKQAIKDFSKCLEAKKERINTATTDNKVVAEFEMPKDLLDGFAKAMTNLQNQTTYNSLFVICLSYLEFSMVELCRLVGIYEGKNFYDYPKGLGINKAKNYLQETIGIDIGQHKFWSNFQMNSSIRNLIAHNNSNIVVNYDLDLESQPNYKLYTQNKKIIDVSETGFIFINELAYIEETHSNQNAFIREVYTKVKSHLQSTRK